MKWNFLSDAGEFFAMHEFNFETANVRDLIAEVSDCKDGDQFAVDIRSLNWDAYIKQYILGIRKYVLKDDNTSLASARRKLAR